MICFNSSALAANNEFTGPLFAVNYFAWMQCSVFPRIVFAILLAVLVKFLMSTADEYLAGTLGVICDMLEMNQQLAGATLLALGNGAPDVFSTLAAFTKGEQSHTDLGLGSLLGSSSVVLTVVLGMVIILQPEEYIQVYFETFGRDVLYVVLAVGMLLVLHWSRWGGTVFIGVMFVLVYVSYVCSVFYQSRQTFQKKKEVTVDMEENVPLVEMAPGQINLIGNYFKLEASIPTTAMIEAPQPARYSMFINGLYWKQLKTRSELARYGKQTIASFAESNILVSFFRLCSLPLEIARTLTVPVPECEAWNRTLILLHPLCCFAFLLALFPSYELFALCAPTATLSTLYLHFMVKESSNNNATMLLRLVLALVAFAMCVLWIYMIASEIVCLLNSFGRILHANPSILGLSVLAWGNSMGDLITNVAIARTGGLSNMAVSACIAGPVFQLLFGLGISMIVASIKFYPQPVRIHLDKFTFPVALLVIAVMLVGLAIARACKYRLSAIPLGVFLCASYFGYIVMIAAVQLFIL